METSDGQGPGTEGTAEPHVLQNVTSTESTAAQSSTRPTRTRTRRDYNDNDSDDDERGKKRLRASTKNITLDKFDIDSPDRKRLVDYGLGKWIREFRAELVGAQALADETWPDTIRFVMLTKFVTGTAKEWLVRNFEALANEPFEESLRRFRLQHRQQIEPLRVLQTLLACRKE